VRLRGIKTVLTDYSAIAEDTIVYLAKERREWQGGKYVSSSRDAEELMGERRRYNTSDHLSVKVNIWLESSIIKTPRSGDAHFNAFLNIGSLAQIGKFAYYSRDSR
jgi:hypothetical protein